MIRVARQRALAIIAWLMIIGGTESMATTVVNLISHHTAIVPFGIPSLALGAGLLAHRAWAIKWSELASVLGGVVALIWSIMLFVLNGETGIPVTRFGRPIGTMNGYVAAVLVGVIAAFNFWAYKTLIRDDVRALARAPQRGAAA